MKKILLLLGLVSLVFMGCPNERETERETERELVAINVKANKTSYTVGESVAPSDIEVVATYYGDGTSTAVSGFTVTPATFSKAGTTTVTVSYSENGVTKTASYMVTVNGVVFVPTASAGSSSDFMKISAGTMLLGSDGSYKVTLTKAFEICKHEVTQKEWTDLMGNNPSYGTSHPADEEVQDLRPVEKVNWYEAIAYCNKRTEIEGIKIGASENIDYVYFSDSSYEAPYTADDASSKKAVYIKVDSENKIASLGYRLPTEAEWEIAARGGSTINGYAGTATNLESYAWYSGNAGTKTHQVMKKKPNGYGLYDMSGNVLEWCWDCYADYPNAAVDPLGPASSWTSSRVTRGGFYRGDAEVCRVAHRKTFEPNKGDYCVGFRVVRSSS